VAANSSFEPPFQTYGLDLPLDPFATLIPQSFEPPHPELAAANHSAGLQVRQNFDEQVRQEITRAGANGSPVALMAIEIDSFGILDDLNDQNCRNDVVGNVAAILSRNGRQGDTVAQYGSKEFTVVLPNTDTADAYCLAESVREEIESTCLLAGMPPKAVWVTVSIGLALFPRDARSTRELFAAAVAGMLEAQRTGGNRVVLHSELELQPGTRHEQRLHIALPVQLWGMDLEGAMFSQDAVAVDITTTGARLNGIAHSLQRGCVVGVKHQNSKARYRVVWVGDASSATEGQVGLQLIDGGKFIWGRTLSHIFGDDQFTAARSRPESGE
jgi:diguanylate cyclase (GGDEF)-like protein